MILNLANVCNADRADILWGFLENYYKDVIEKNFHLYRNYLSTVLNTIKISFYRIKTTDHQINLKNLVC